MNKTLNKWLVELESEFQLDNQSEDNVANENLHSFSLKDGERASLTIEEVIEFLEGCRDVVKEKSCQSDLLFYSWVDELAGRLCFSVVPASISALPFGCEVVKSDIRTVASQFIRMETSLYDEDYLNVWVNDI